MATKNASMPQSEPDFDKFLEIEVAELFQAMMATNNLRVQVYIFFGTVFLGAVGISFTAEKAGLIMLSSMLLWALILVDARARIILRLFSQRALELQAHFAPPGVNTFLGLFSRDLSVEVVDPTTKVGTSVQHLPFDTLILKSPLLFTFWVPLLGSFVTIGLGLILWLEYGWSLF